VFRKKKGRRAAANNYFPVSLTCILCKAIKRLVRKQVLEFLEQNNLLSKRQHGFVPRHSCLTQILDAMDILSTGQALFYEGGTVDVIYMDYQKAFNCVPHQRLLAKVSALGIRGNVHAVAWIHNFLSDRF
jgi:hypothetical protein